MRVTKKYIFFWGGIYSQWYLRDIVLKDITFNCNEQYMMWSKAMLFNDEVTAKKILAEKEPKQQKILGREVKNFNKEKWEAVARNIVYEANYAKFTQHEDLLDELMRTGEKQIVEASPFDLIWGIGMGERDRGIEDPKNWRGTNWLGIAIMQVRNKIKEQ